VLFKLKTTNLVSLQMTGRKGRVVSTDDGNVQYESRSESDTPLELLNLAEKQRFMNGEKVNRIKLSIAVCGCILNYVYIV